MVLHPTSSTMPSLREGLRRCSAERESSAVDYDTEAPYRGRCVDYALELSFCHRCKEACSSLDCRKHSCDEALEQHSPQHDRNGTADGGGRLPERRGKPPDW